MPLKKSLPLVGNSLIYIGFMPNAIELNRRILEVYLQLGEHDFFKCTHFFNGRYENLYLLREHIPAISCILDQAENYAANILQNNQSGKLRSGFWINDMGPGAITTEHDHDEDDELLSGVIRV